MAGAIATVAALWTTSAIPVAAAAQTATFSVTPTNSQSYFVFNSSVGRIIYGKVRVTNAGTTPGQVQLSPVDATTGQTSGAVYLSPSAPRRDVGAWITLSTTRLTLGAHRGAVVGFAVHVPSAAAGGQHLGGLVAAPLQAGATHVSHRGAHTFKVNVREISIVAVQVNLPASPLQQMGITGLRASGRPGYQTLLIGLSNTGNTLVKGRGGLTVADAGGTTVLKQQFQLDTFVPQTSIEFPVYATHRLASGSYNGTVDLTYGRGHHVARQLAFTISSRQVRQTFGSSALGSGSSSGSSVPVWLIAAGAVALVAVSVGASAFVFRRRSQRVP